MATLEDVRRLALAMPGAQESTMWGSAAWKVRKVLFVWERPLRKGDLEHLGEAAPEGAVMGARVEHEQAKLALLADPSGAFFTTPHFDGHPIILVALERVDLETLEEVVVEAWLNRASATAAAKWLQARGAG